MQYPIKYIENNLVWNHDGECFAYYELIPYNYSFLSVEQKEAVHDAFRQLIAQNRDGKIHALQISTESQHPCGAGAFQGVCFRQPAGSGAAPHRRTDGSPCLH